MNAAVFRSNLKVKSMPIVPDMETTDHGALEMRYTRGDGETVVSIPSRFINPSLKRPVPLAKLNYNDTRRRYMQTVKEPSMCGKCKEAKCNKNASYRF